MTIESKILHVYKSSAGSGKTTRLSIEYLKLALGKKDAFKHILALTFTNKAAQEMKERILDNLQELIQISDQEDEKNDPFYLNDLFENIPKYKQVLESKNRQEARKLLKSDAYLLYRKLLHHYSEYAVTTLDSFTNRLIRSFSHDLGLSFNYQVELDTAQLLKDTVEELVNRIGIHEDMLTIVLTRYSQQKIDSETSRRINRELESRAKSLLSDVDEKHLKPLRSLEIEDIIKVQKGIIIEIANFEKQLQELGSEFVGVCQQAGIEAKMFYQGGKSIYPYFDRFRLKDFKYLQPNSFVQSIIESDKWTTKTAPAENKQLIESVSEKLKQIYHASQELLKNNVSDYLLMLQIKSGIFPYMVLMELEKILSQIKQENQMVHISDFNKIISEEIAQESAPYIYERIGNKYQHYLLDEFQDTSVIQWHNLLPLVENSLSENNFNLIVGDAKQAIYRWRGSEVEQFAQLPELLGDHKDLLLKQRENMLKNAYFEINLNTNYRSDNTIIDFNNQLFQFIIDRHFLPENLLSIYKDHWQKVKNENIIAGVVDVHLIDLPAKSKKSKYTEAYHKRTLEIIQECKENGYQYMDIAVLARGNKDLISLAQYLIENDIPIVSSESLHVDSSPKVQFVLSLIKHIQQPKELLFQVEIIKYLLEFGALKEEGLASLSKHLMELDAIDELRKYWNKLDAIFDIPMLNSLEAYEAVEALIRLLKLDTSEPLLHFFIEASYVFTQEKHQGLKEFLDWWALKHEDFSLDVPEDWDAVKLMTFHKAKGLEFPVVINWFSQKLNKDKSGQSTVWIDPKLEKFPDLKSFPFKISSLKDTVHQNIYDQEINKGILDDVNLFYVANTRPTEKLFLIVDKMPLNESSSNSFPFDRLMHEFIESADMYAIDDDVFRMAEEKNLKKEKALGENTDATFENIQLLVTKQTDDWRKIINLSIDKDHEKIWNESAAWGQKVHAVLAEINSEKDIDSALEKLIYKGVMSQDEKDVLTNLVLEVIHHPQLAQYYQPDIQVFNEREMIDEKGEIFRPDRMVKKDGEAIIIDYKTGQPNEKDKNQVKNYMQIVASLLQEKVSGFLVYLHEDIIVEEV